MEVKWTFEKMREAMRRTIESVKRETPPLNFQLAAERATAHRVAHHMEKEFAGWNVDCEYDRDGQTKKALMGIKGCVEAKATDEIIPDIIIHRREAQGRENNLLVVELKKSSADDSCDREKLERLTSATGHYQYQFGLYVNIASGRFDCRWFIDGCEWGAPETVAKKRRRRRRRRQVGAPAPVAACVAAQVDSKNPPPEELIARAGERPVLSQNSPGGPASRAEDPKKPQPNSPELEDLETLRLLDARFDMLVQASKLELGRIRDIMQTFGEHEAGGSPVVRRFAASFPARARPKLYAIARPVYQNLSRIRQRRLSPLETKDAYVALEIFQLIRERFAADSLRESLDVAINHLEHLLRGDVRTHCWKCQKDFWRSEQNRCGDCGGNICVTPTCKSCLCAYRGY